MILGLAIIAACNSPAGKPDGPHAPADTPTDALLGDCTEPTQGVACLASLSRGTSGGAFSCETGYAVYTASLPYWRISLGVITNPLPGVMTAALGQIEVAPPPMTGGPLTLVADASQAPALSLLYDDHSYYTANVSPVAGSISFTVSNLTPRIGGTPGDQCAHGVVDATLVNATNASDEVTMHVTF